MVFEHNGHDNDIGQNDILLESISVRTPIRSYFARLCVLVVTGNGDPSSHEPDRGSTRTVFNGLARALVQSAKVGAGAVTVRATAPGLTPGKCVVHVGTSSLHDNALVAPSPITRSVDFEQRAA